MERDATRTGMPGGGDRRRGSPRPSPNGCNGEAHGHADGTAAPAAALPAPAAAEGRDAGGRFARGNRGGPGHPHARRVAALRSALLEALTPERLRALAERLYDRALGGDTAAAKLLLAYALGRPAPPVDPDRLDLDEWRLRQDCPKFGDVIEAAGRIVLERAFIRLQELEPGVSQTVGATIVPLRNLLSEVAQLGAEPATGQPPAP